MGVKLTNIKTEEGLNGLDPLEEYFLKPDNEPLFAIVVVDTARDVNDRLQRTKTPVVYFPRIEPILEPDEVETVRGILQRAYDRRENKAPLPLDGLEQSDADFEAAAPDAAPEKPKRGRGKLAAVESTGDES